MSLDCQSDTMTIGYNSGTETHMELYNDRSSFVPKQGGTFRFAWKIENPCGTLWQIFISDITYSGPNLVAMSDR